MHNVIFTVRSCSRMDVMFPFLPSKCKRATMSRRMEREDTSFPFLMVTSFPFSQRKLSASLLNQM